MNEFSIGDKVYWYEGKTKGVVVNIFIDAVWCEFEDQVPLPFFKHELMDIKNITYEEDFEKLVQD
jgi:hypothetical protein